MTASQAPRALQYRSRRSTEPTPTKAANPLVDLPAIFRCQPNRRRGVLTRWGVETALRNANNVPADSLVQENVVITLPDEPPNAQSQPYKIIEKVVGHGTAVDGMPELPGGAPVWRVRWYA